jgi:nickel-dependent lactate racemase
MTEIRLGYGRDRLSFTFDQERFRVLSEDEATRPPLTDVEIGAAFDSPIESPCIEDQISAGESVLIVVSDATRSTASAQVVNLLVRRLIQNGVHPSDLQIIFATGIHRAVTKQETVELLTPFIAQRVRTTSHDAFDQANLVLLGTTENGVPIEVNRALKDFDHVVITGAIGFHYFAGFTGGRKSICPGLASAQTIKATHALALDFETGKRRAGVGTALLDGNAVNEACESIAAIVNPSFAINSIVDGRGRAVGLYTGDWRAAHRQGCKDYLESHSLKIETRRELVVVSCGGFPYDINLIQAHKALEMAAHACTEGGTIILLAECGDGLGRSDFLKWFAERDSNSLAARLREGYEVNGQTAWALLTKSERYDIHLVSRLPDHEVRLMRMIPAKSLGEAVKRVGPGMHGYLMPRGAALLPREE